MLKYFRMTLIMGLMLAMTGIGFAQEAKTADELKAEREQLTKELKSKDASKREEKLGKLAQKAPEATSLQSVDGLAHTAKGVLMTVVSINEVLSKYKRDLKDNGNGEVDIVKYKANRDDYRNLADTLLEASARIVVGTAQLKNAQDDVKTLPPLKAKPVLNSVKYSSEALKLSGEEIAFQLKIINNLIATIKSSENL
jgi:formate dehydrogenase maturation protein FdhE